MPDRFAQADVSVSYDVGPVEGYLSGGFGFEGVPARYQPAFWVAFYVALAIIIVTTMHVGFKGAIQP